MTTRITIEGPGGERQTLEVTHFLLVGLSADGGLLTHAQSNTLDLETRDELLSEAREESTRHILDPATQPME